MAKVLKIFNTLTIVTIMLASNLAGQPGCMEKSYKMKCHSGYDYKTLHYVECSCPCARYRQLDRKGKCSRCGHYTQMHGWGTYRAECTECPFKKLIKKNQ